MRIEKGKPFPIDDVLKAYVKAMRISASLNTHRIFEAWDTVSGAKDITLNRFFRAGILYITLSSSVARTSLEMQRNELVYRINALLSNDPLFTKDDKSVGFVTELRLK